MFRRDIFRLGLFGLLPRTRPLAQPAAVRRVELAEFFVAGFQHHDGMHASVEGALRPGDPLDVRPEPDNPHDELALALHMPGGAMLGYVPRRLNAVPARITLQGVRLTAQITDVDPGAPPWERVSVRLFEELSA